MTAAEISAESHALMAAIAERVRARDFLQQSLSAHSTREERRAVADRCRQLRALNRDAQKRLLRLDAQWEALMRGCAHAA